MQRERFVAFEIWKTLLLADNGRIVDELKRVEAYLAGRKAGS